MEEVQIRYALIRDGIVDNVIICNDVEILSVYESQYDHIELLDTEEENKICGVGAHWDSANGIFFYPPPDPIYIIEKEEFRNRFTRTEKIALYETAKADIAVQVFLDDLNTMTFVDVSNQDIIDSINHLVSVGVIAQSRVEEILKPN